MGWDFLQPSRPAVGPTYLAIKWVLGLFWGLKRPELGDDHAPHLTPRLKKEQTYNSTPLWIFMACSVVNFTLGRHVLFLCTFFFQLPHIFSLYYDKRICVKAKPCLHRLNHDRWITEAISTLIILLLSRIRWTVCFVTPAHIAADGWRKCASSSTSTPVRVSFNAFCDVWSLLCTILLSAHCTASICQFLQVVTFFNTNNQTELG